MMKTNFKFVKEQKRDKNIKDQFDQNFAKKIDQMLDIVGNEFSGIIILKHPDKKETFAASFFREDFGVDITSGIPKIDTRKLNNEQKLEKTSTVLLSIGAIEICLNDLILRYRQTIERLAVDYKALGGEID